MCWLSSANVETKGICAAGYANGQSAWKRLRVGRKKLSEPRSNREAVLAFAGTLSDKKMEISRGGVAADLMTVSTFYMCLVVCDKKRPVAYYNKSRLIMVRVILIILLFFPFNLALAQNQDFRCTHRISLPQKTDRISLRSELLTLSLIQNLGNSKVHNRTYMRAILDGSCVELIKEHSYCYKIRFVEKGQVFEGYVVNKYKEKSTLKVVAPYPSAEKSGGVFKNMPLLVVLGLLVIGVAFLMLFLLSKRYFPKKSCSHLDTLGGLTANPPNTDKNNTIEN